MILLFEYFSVLMCLDLPRFDELSSIFFGFPLENGIMIQENSSLEIVNKFDHKKLRKFNKFPRQGGTRLE
jgi:hypothetical protein